MWPLPRRCLTAVGCSSSALLFSNFFFFSLPRIKSTFWIQMEKVKVKLSFPLFSFIRNRPLWREKSNWRVSVSFTDTRCFWRALLFRTTMCPLYVLNCLFFLATEVIFFPQQGLILKFSSSLTCLSKPEARWHITTYTRQCLWRSSESWHL